MAEGKIIDTSKGDALIAYRLSTKPTPQDPPTNRGKVIIDSGATDSPSRPVNTWPSHHLSLGG